MKSVRLFRQNSRGIAPIILVAVLICVYGIHAAQAAVTLVRFEINSNTSTRITLEWETASEYNNLGFFVTRSTSETGTYTRITDFITAEGSAVSGSIYQYIDQNVQAGQTYYYKLEAIDIHSVSEYFGPLIVTAGQAAATASPTATSTQTSTKTNTGTVYATTTVTRTATITQTASVTPTATETSPFRFSTNTSTATASITPLVTETTVASLTPKPEASSTATKLVVKTSTLEITATSTIVPTPATESKQSSPLLLMVYGFLGVILVGGAALIGYIWYLRRAGDGE